VLAGYNTAGNTIGSLRRDYGEGTVRAMLVLLWIDFLEYFSLGNGMGRRQVEKMVVHVLETYYYLTFADFKVFFDMAQRNEFGATYNRIDGQVIFGWLERYADYRMEDAGERERQAAFSLTGTDQRKYTAQTVEQIMGDFRRRTVIEPFDPFDHSVVPPLKIPASRQPVHIANTEAAH